MKFKMISFFHNKWGRPYTMPLPNFLVLKRSEKFSEMKKYIDFCDVINERPISDVLTKMLGRIISFFSQKCSTFQEKGLETNDFNLTSSGFLFHLIACFDE